MPSGEFGMCKEGEEGEKGSDGRTKNEIFVYILRPCKNVFAPQRNRNVYNRKMKNAKRLLAGDKPER